MKCDENRPACKRCISTGRVCDGYGIWGGGGNHFSERLPLKECLPVQVTGYKQLPLPSTLVGISSAEQDSFQWFTCQAVKKFPGLFPSPFWSTLVCQASSSEPAVLHAVLAFSSAHQKDGIDTGRPARSQKYPDSLEQFTLLQYSTAIGLLQPHFERKTRDGMRIALVTCLVFIHMEFLRGHYKTANVHLQNGLRLLRELRGETLPERQDMVVRKPFNHFVDRCIVETFIRLQSQAIMLGQPPTNLYPIWHFEFESSTLEFCSVREARGSLNEILDEISYLTELYSRQNRLEYRHISVDLYKQQFQIEAALSSWFKRYKSLQVTPPSQMFTREGFLYIVLKFLYTMAKIMVNISLWSTSQLIYDSYLPDFISIINQAVGIRNIIMTTNESRVMPGVRNDLSDATADVAWLTPLYFTALKCRNHRLRAKAIKLLGSIPHKEGMWDATMAASIATQVMDIEEGDFYDGFEIQEDLSVCKTFVEGKMELPVLPEANRLHEIKVLLPDNEEEKVVLTCRRRLKNGGCETIVRECEMLPRMRIQKPGRAMRSA